MGVSKNLKDVEFQDQIEYLLKVYPSTRNSDKLLWLFYLEVFGDHAKTIGPVNLDKFAQLLLANTTPVMETVSRTRRKIQARGKYKAAKKVRSHRLIEENNVREWATRPAL